MGNRRDGFKPQFRQSPANPGPLSRRPAAPSGDRQRSSGPAARSTPSGSPLLRPPMGLMTTTLWEYPSQHYTAADGSQMQGDSKYVGATPSWVIWQLLSRYTKPSETVLDPMCGSGTTLDVCKDLGRTGTGFDLISYAKRSDIKPADARKLPLTKDSVDFVFVDPPYSTHVNYSDDPRCIGKLDAAGEDSGHAYFEAMSKVISEMHRVLRPGRHMALYVSDSFRVTQRAGKHVFTPIGFHLFSMMCELMQPVDIIAVVRHNEKLTRGNYHKAAEEQNFYLRGFNYLFVMQKP